MVGASNDEAFDAALGAKDEIASARRDFEEAILRVGPLPWKEQAWALREALEFMNAYAGVVRSHFGNGPIYEYAVGRIRGRIMELGESLEKQIRAMDLIVKPATFADADVSTKAHALLIRAALQAMLNDQGK